MAHYNVIYIVTDPTGKEVFKGSRDKCFSMLRKTPRQRRKDLCVVYMENGCGATCLKGDVFVDECLSSDLIELAKSQGLDPNHYIYLKETLTQLKVWVFA